MTLSILCKMDSNVTYVVAVTIFKCTGLFEASIVKLKNAGIPQNCMDCRYKAEPVIQISLKMAEYSESHPPIANRIAI